MHILILAPTAGAVEKIQTALSSIVHRCSVAETWTDVLASLKSDRPDLILVESSKAFFPGGIKIIDLLNR